MGLGKTLQTVAMVASDHHDWQQRIRKRLHGEKGTADDDDDEEEEELSSLVICPSTLCGHWVGEVQKFISTPCLRPMLYAGPRAARAELAKGMHLANLVVTSYEVARSDADLLSARHWNYLVLDEGHVIKNGRAKTTLAVKRFRARHRLVLTGTPIQNSVLELWSLFDFLMPGFLGTERQFNARYSRPIVASRDPKCSPREQEAGALAMEALHRQVLPFVLRRMKEDVLADLPPKITQDFYCDLSPVQVQKFAIPIALKKNYKVSH